MSDPRTKAERSKAIDAAIAERQHVILLERPPDGTRRELDGARLAQRFQPVAAGRVQVHAPHAAAALNDRPPTRRRCLPPALPDPQEGPAGGHLGMQPIAMALGPDHCPGLALLEGSAVAPLVLRPIPLPLEDDEPGTVWSISRATSMPSHCSDVLASSTPSAYGSQLNIGRMLADVLVQRPNGHGRSVAWHQV